MLGSLDRGFNKKDDVKHPCFSMSSCLTSPPHECNRNFFPQPGNLFLQKMKVLFFSVFESPMVTESSVEHSVEPLIAKAFEWSSFWVELPGIVRHALSGAQKKGQEEVPWPKDNG